MAMWVAELDLRHLAQGRQEPHGVPVKACCSGIEDSLLLVPLPEPSPCLEGPREGSPLKVTVCSGLQQLK